MNANPMTVRNDCEQVEIEFVHLLVRAEQVSAPLGAASDQESHTRFDAARKRHVPETASGVPTIGEGKLATLGMGMPWQPMAMVAKPPTRVGSKMKMAKMAMVAIANQGRV